MRWSDLQIYKPGQGAVARWSAYGLLAALLLYGAASLHGFLLGLSGSEGAGVPWLQKDLLGGPLPVVQWRVNVAFLVALVVYVGSVAGVHLFLNRPLSADLLIETEMEMRKVTWSSLPDALTSSVVVIGTVIAFSLFLAGADYALNLVLMNGLFGLAG